MNYHDMIIKTNVGLSMGMKQESMKYTDVASFAQAAFESASYSLRLLYRIELPA